VTKVNHKTSFHEVMGVNTPSVLSATQERFIRTTVLMLQVVIRCLLVYHSRYRNAVDFANLSDQISERPKGTARINLTKREWTQDKVGDTRRGGNNKCRNCVSGVSNI
jgi:hypothetical protein